MLSISKRHNYICTERNAADGCHLFVVKNEPTAPATAHAQTCIACVLSNWTVSTCKQCRVSERSRRVWTLRRCRPSSDAPPLLPTRNACREQKVIRRMRASAGSALLTCLLHPSSIDPSENNRYRCKYVGARCLHRSSSSINGLDAPLKPRVMQPVSSVCDSCFWLVWNAIIASAL